MLTPGEYTALNPLASPEHRPGGESLSSPAAVDAPVPEHRHRRFELVTKQIAYPAHHGGRSDSVSTDFTCSDGSLIEGLSTRLDQGNIDATCHGYRTVKNLWARRQALGAVDARACVEGDRHRRVVVDLHE